MIDEVTQIAEPSNENEVNSTNNIVQLSNEEFDKQFKDIGKSISEQYHLILENLLVNKTRPDGSFLSIEEYNRMIDKLNKGKDIDIGRLVRTVTCSNGMKVDIVIDVNSIIRFNHGKESDSWFD